MLFALLLATSGNIWNLVDQNCYPALSRPRPDQAGVDASQGYLLLCPCTMSFAQQVTAPDVRLAITLGKEVTSGKVLQNFYFQDPLVLEGNGVQKSRRLLTSVPYTYTPSELAKHVQQNGRMYTALDDSVCWDVLLSAINYKRTRLPSQIETKVLFTDFQADLCSRKHACGSSSYEPGQELLKLASNVTDGDCVQIDGDLPGDARISCIDKCMTPRLVPDRPYCAVTSKDGSCYLCKHHVEGSSKIWPPSFPGCSPAIGGALELAKAECAKHKDCHGVYADKLHGICTVPETHKPNGRDHLYFDYYYKETLFTEKQHRLRDIDYQSQLIQRSVASVEQCRLDCFSHAECIAWEHDGESLECALVRASNASVPTAVAIENLHADYHGLEVTDACSGSSLKHTCSGTCKTMDDLFQDRSLDKSCSDDWLSCDPATKRVCHDNHAHLCVKHKGMSPFEINIQATDVPVAAARANTALSAQPALGDAVRGGVNRGHTACPMGQFQTNVEVTNVLPSAFTVPVDLTPDSAAADDSDVCAAVCALKLTSYMLVDNQDCYCSNDKDAWGAGNSNGTAKVYIINCAACPRGKFQPYDRSTGCHQCPLGKFSSDTRAACNTCGLRHRLVYHNDDITDTSCEPCAPDEISTNDGLECRQESSIASDAPQRDLLTPAPTPAPTPTLPAFLQGARRLNEQDTDGICKAASDCIEGRRPLTCDDIATMYEYDTQEKIFSSRGMDLINDKLLKAFIDCKVPPDNQNFGFSYPTRYLWGGKRGRQEHYLHRHWYVPFLKKWDADLNKASCHAIMKAYSILPGYSFNNVASNVRQWWGKHCNWLRTQDRWGGTCRGISNVYGYNAYHPRINPSGQPNAPAGGEARNQFNVFTHFSSIMLATVPASSFTGETGLACGYTELVSDDPTTTSTGAEFTFVIWADSNQRFFQPATIYANTRVSVLQRVLWQHQHLMRAMTRGISATSSNHPGDCPSTMISRPDLESFFPKSTRHGYLPIELKGSKGNNIMRKCNLFPEPALVGQPFSANDYATCTLTDNDWVGMVPGGTTGSALLDDALKSWWKSMYCTTIQEPVDSTDNMFSSWQDSRCKTDDARPACLPYVSYPEYEGFAAHFAETASIDITGQTMAFTVGTQTRCLATDVIQQSTQSSFEECIQLCRDEVTCHYATFTVGIAGKASTCYLLPDCATRKRDSTARSVCIHSPSTGRTCPFVEKFVNFINNRNAAPNADAATANDEALNPLVISFKYVHMFQPSHGILLAVERGNPVKDIATEKDCSMHCLLSDTCAGSMFGVQGFISTKAPPPAPSCHAYDSLSRGDNPEGAQYYPIKVKNTWAIVQDVVVLDPTPQVVGATGEMGVSLNDQVVHNHCNEGPHVSKDGRIQRTCKGPDKGQGSYKQNAEDISTHTRGVENIGTFGSDYSPNHRLRYGILYISSTAGDFMTCQDACDQDDNCIAYTLRPATHREGDSVGGKDSLDHAPIGFVNETNQNRVPSVLKNDAKIVFLRSQEGLQQVQFIVECKLLMQDQHATQVDAVKAAASVRQRAAKTGVYEQDNIPACVFDSNTVTTTTACNMREAVIDEEESGLDRTKFVSRFDFMDPLDQFWGVTAIKPNTVKLQKANLPDKGGGKPGGPPTLLRKMQCIRACDKTDGCAQVIASAAGCSLIDESEMSTTLQEDTQYFTPATKPKQQFKKTSTSGVLGDGLTDLYNIVQQNQLANLCPLRAAWSGPDSGPYTDSEGTSDEACLTQEYVESVLGEIASRYETLAWRKTDIFTVDGHTAVNDLPAPFQLPGQGNFNLSPLDIEHQPAFILHNTDYPASDASRSIVTLTFPKARYNANPIPGQDACKSAREYNAFVVRNGKVDAGMSCASRQVAENYNLKCKGLDDYSPATITTQCTMCQLCAVGKFGYDGACCEPCPLGRFQPSEGAHVCDKCPSGLFAGSIGQASCDGDAMCPAGKFGNTGITAQAATGCQNCPVGKYQPGQGAGDCSLCPGGKFTDTAGAAACKGIECPPGQFATGPFCEVCPTGKFAQKPGSRQCSDCPEGRSGAINCDVSFDHACLTQNTCDNAMAPVCAQWNSATPADACGPSDSFIKNATGLTSCAGAATTTPTMDVRAACLHYGLTDGPSFDFQVLPYDLSYSYFADDDPVNQHVVKPLRCGDAPHGAQDPSLFDDAFQPNGNKVRLPSNRTFVSQGNVLMRLGTDFWYFATDPGETVTCSVTAVQNYDFTHAVYANAVPAETEACYTTWKNHLHPNCGRATDVQAHLRCSGDTIAPLCPLDMHVQDGQCVSDPVVFHGFELDNNWHAGVSRKISDAVVTNGTQYTVDDTGSCHHTVTVSQEAGCSLDALYLGNRVDECVQITDNLDTCSIQCDNDCGPHGVAHPNGAACECMCALGYAGDLCDRCADPFAQEENCAACKGSILMDTAGGCTQCAVGRDFDALCEACLPGIELSDATGECTVPTCSIQPDVRTSKLDSVRDIELLFTVNGQQKFTGMRGVPDGVVPFHMQFTLFTVNGMLVWIDGQSWHFAYGMADAEGITAVDGDWLLALQHGQDIAQADVLNTTYFECPGNGTTQATVEQCKAAFPGVFYYNTNTTVCSNTSAGQWHADCVSGGIMTASPRRYANRTRATAHTTAPDDMATPIETKYRYGRCVTSRLHTRSYYMSKWYKHEALVHDINVTSTTGCDLALLAQFAATSHAANYTVPQHFHSSFVSTLNECNAVFTDTTVHDDDHCWMVDPLWLDSVLTASDNIMQSASTFTADQVNARLESPRVDMIDQVDCNTQWEAVESLEACATQWQAWLYDHGTGTCCRSVVLAVPDNFTHKMWGGHLDQDAADTGVEQLALDQKTPAQAVSNVHSNKACCRVCMGHQYWSRDEMTQTCFCHDVTAQPSLSSCENASGVVLDPDSKYLGHKFFSLDAAAAVGDSQATCNAAGTCSVDPTDPARCLHIPQPRIWGDTSKCRPYGADVVAVDARVTTAVIDRASFITTEYGGNLCVDEPASPDFHYTELNGGTAVSNYITDTTVAGKLVSHMSHLPFIDADAIPKNTGDNPEVYTLKVFDTGVQRQVQACKEVSVQYSRFFEPTGRSVACNNGACSFDMEKTIDLVSKISAAYRAAVQECAEHVTETMEARVSLLVVVVGESGSVFYPETMSFEKTPPFLRPVVVPETVTPPATTPAPTPAPTPPPAPGTIVQDFCSYTQYNNTKYAESVAMVTHANLTLEQCLDKCNLNIVCRLVEVDGHECRLRASKGTAAYDVRVGCPHPTPTVTDAATTYAKNDCCHAYVVEL